MLCPILTHWPNFLKSSLFYFQRQSENKWKPNSSVNQLKSEISELWNEKKIFFILGPSFSSFETLFKNSS